MPSSINALATRIGEEFVTVREELGEYLPLSGGTMTGGLFGVTADATDTAEIDVSTASVFLMSLYGDTEIDITGTPESAAACFTLILIDGGSFNVTWPDTVHWTDETVPDLSSGATDVLTFVTADGGETWYGCVAVSGAGA